MPLNIIRNDISLVKANAIVNTANANVAVGAGVDEAIYKAAGYEKLLAERAKIGPMKPGQAAWTPAFDLDADYIIHTVGPAWRGGDYQERETVASCYRESLRIADELKCESVAFPLISTGTFGFPKDEALRIAVSEISSFLFTHDMTVYMVVYDKESFVISGKAFPNIRTYIEERDVKKPKSSRTNRPQQVPMASSYSESRWSKKRKKAKEDLVYELDTFHSIAPEESVLYESVEAEDIPCESSSLAGNLFGDDVEGHGEALDEILRRRAETFQQQLFRLIDRKGMTDPEVYKRANVDRKLFSKIRSKENYLPSKKTVLAFAIALELNLDETMDLLRRAGYALNPSSNFDLIVEYCINHRIYNIHVVNVLLFDRTEQVLAG